MTDRPYAEHPSCPVPFLNFIRMILVTGGTGLVGSHLIFQLASAGEKVRALKRNSSDLATTKKIFAVYSIDHEKLFSSIEWVEGDILDVESIHNALEGVDLVFHCAGLVSLDPREGELILRTNSEGTANMVNACLANGNIKKFCHVSSVAALGDVPQDVLITEEFEWKGCARDNYYSISKYNAEREVWRASVEGLNVVIVNPAVVIGPGNWNMSSCLIFKEANKRIWYYPSGTAGYVDVRDVAGAMVMLVKSNSVNERFILAAENFSLREFSDMVHDVLGKKRSFIHAGPFLLGLAWRLEKVRCLFTGKKKVITKTIAQAVQERTSFSSEKLKRVTGFEFIRVIRSVKDTAEAFVKEYNS